MIATTKSSSEPTSPQEASCGPEFLVVCADSNVFRAVAAAVRKVKGRLNCASAISSARDYLARRKVDGVVVDLRLDGAMEMVVQLRSANLGKSMVIFACSRHDAETQAALRAGANFVLGQPLIADKIANIFALSTTMMTSEKRRYSRHPLMVPVELEVNGLSAESTMSNLSEAGMAIWSLQTYPRGSALRFSFELPFGGRIQGKGEITWVNADGLSGVRFNILDDKAYSSLSNWIALRNAKPGPGRRVIPTYPAH
jgi:ActR/RegA family two-component response regulator